MDTQIFRFLDLPAELRLMVYDHLTPDIHRSTWKAPTTSTTSDTSTTELSSIVTTEKVLSPAILRVCKVIHTEADPILSKELQKMMPEPFRLNVRCVDDSQPLDRKAMFEIMMRIVEEARRWSRRKTYIRSTLPDTYDLEIALDVSVLTRGYKLHDALKYLLGEMACRDKSCIVYCNGPLPPWMSPISGYSIEHSLEMVEDAILQTCSMRRRGEKGFLRMPLVRLSKEKWSELQARWMVS
jgi:hypothetical protein